jgi:non-canonical purine NTP pyrophosphatase (RdgB/HAM1 family)
MTLAEDSGLVVPGLNGLPGKESSNLYQLTVDEHFNIVSVPEGELYDRRRNEHVDDLNNQRLVELLEKAGSMSEPARFVSVFALAEKGLLVTYFIGESSGTVIREGRGTSAGFGYDPHFVADDCHGWTYAEIDSYRKNLKSHRRRALNKVFDYFAKQLLTR